jgi:uncharacterized protein YegP (UPF0339 family)
MAGMFELYNDEDSNFRFRITGPEGAVMATSRAFPDKGSAVAGIRDMREYAGMGHITDVCRSPVAPHPQLQNHWLPENRPQVPSVSARTQTFGTS